MKQKISIILTAIGIMTSTASAENCKVNDPDIATEYSGECKNGLANGYGKAKGRDSYEGSFVDGNANGKGIYIWFNNNKYEGDWKSGKRTGKGIFSWADGYKYEGSFVDGRMMGKGISTWPNGKKYEGDFVDNNRTGKGRESTEKYTIEGNFFNGASHGFGAISWSNGDKYEGDWKNGKRTGKGILTLADNNRYEGDFVDGNRTGKGIYSYKSGSVYEGEWKDGVRTGFGIMRIKKDEEKTIKTYNNKGVYKGNYYVITGEFKDNNFIKTTPIPENIQNRIDEDAKVDFERAKKLATIEAYKQFFEDRPNSSYISQISTLLDKKIDPEYQKVLKQKNITALKEFADKYTMSPKSKEALGMIEQIKQQEQKEQAIKEAKKFNQLGHCAVGETVYHRETWDSTTSSGNVLADALFGASTKESFLIEFEGIVKGFVGNKVEVYLQDYAVKQTRGGGIFQPVTNSKGRLADYADKKVGKSFFYDKSRCGN